MERKIGEIFEHEGEWYQCVESDICEECSITNTECGSGAKSDIAFEIFGTCSKARRADNKHAIFKKLEKVGEPYPLYGHTVQRYAGIKSPLVLPREPYACFNLSNSTIDIEVKQDKENKEDMEANEKTISIPDGWEFDRIDNNGNIVLKEKKTELPKTWLKCLESVNDLELIDTGNNVEKWNFTTLGGNGYIFGEAEHNLLPRGLGRPMLALCQLLVCRNAWWKHLGWKPDWTDRTEYYYCITNYSGVIDTPTYSLQNTILAFPSEDIANQFLETFRDLIEEAKELL